MSINKKAKHRREFSEQILLFWKDLASFLGLFVPNQENLDCYEAFRKDETNETTIFFSKGRFWLVDEQTRTLSSVKAAWPNRAEGPFLAYDVNKDHGSVTHMGRSAFRRGKTFLKMDYTMAFFMTFATFFAPGGHSIQFHTWTVGNKFCWKDYISSLWVNMSSKPVKVDMQWNRERFFCSSLALCTERCAIATK